MLVKKKKCKCIKSDFNTCNELVIVYKFGMCRNCFIKWATTTEEGSVFIAKTAIKAKVYVKKENKIKDDKLKKEITPLNKLKKMLEHNINYIVRLIDAKKPCISCNHGKDTPYTRQMHAGHYFSVGSDPSLRYNVFNIYNQCSVCNNYKSSNERGYDIGLTNMYGKEYFDYVTSLKSLYPSIKLSRDEIYDAIDKSRELIKRLKNGELLDRSYINEYIGIYKK